MSQQESYNADVLTTNNDVRANNEQEKYSVVLFLLLAVAFIVFSCITRYSQIRENLRMYKSGYVHIFSLILSLIQDLCIFILPLLAAFFNKKKIVTKILSIIIALASILSFVSCTKVVIWSFNYYSLYFFVNSLFYLIMGTSLILYSFGVLKKQVISLIFFSLGTLSLLTFFIFKLLIRFHPFSFNGNPLLFYACAVGMMDIVKINTKGEKVTVPHKNKLTAILLSIFLGGLGIDRFYLGYTILGIIKLLTGGGFGIWILVDIILICTGALQPADGSQWKDEVHYAQDSENNEVNKLEAIEKLARLHDQGILTDEEFQQKKTEVLSKI